MINWLKDLFKSEHVVKWDKPLPYVEGYKDINATKECMAKHILKLLVNGQRLSAMLYAKEHHSTKFGARISDLRLQYGLPIQDEWHTNQNTNKRYKVYYIKKETV